MANQTFTNSPINDKQFAALQVQPKAPIGNFSNVNVPDITQGCENLFGPRNVHENSSLSFLKNQLVPVPENAPINIKDFTQAKDSQSEAKMKKVEANRVYAARYRLKQQEKIEHLKREKDWLQVEVSRIESQLHYWSSVYSMVVKENAMLKAHFQAALQEKAEKDAITETLIQEINRLKRQQFY